VAGVAAGLLASFFLEQFQSLWNQLSKELNPRRSESESKDEPSSVQVPQAISTGLTNQKIRWENTQKRVKSTTT
jgi:hypothetical protein